MSQVEHMEVAPRMWDKTIAATYVPKSKERHLTEPDDDTNTEVISAGSPSATVPVVTAVSFFSRLKTYLMPAIFVICLIIVVYVLWKYFTKYRNAKKAAIDCSVPTINEADILKLQTKQKHMPDPRVIIQTEDMSKYEYDSDDSDADDSPPPTLHRHLSMIEEEEEKDSSEDSDKASSKTSSKASDDESSDEDSDDDQASDEDDDEASDDEGEEGDDEDAMSVDSFNNKGSELMVPSIPDISAIEQLISDNQYDADMSSTMSLPILEDEFSIDIPAFASEEMTTPARATKPKRKTKRITL